MPKRIPAEKALHYRKQIEPITDVIVRYLEVGPHIPFSGRTRAATLSRSLILYFAAQRTHFSHTELGYAFNTDNTAVLRAVRKYEVEGALPFHEYKCLKDLRGIFSDIDAEKGDAPLLEGTERLVLVLEPASLNRLKKIHASGLFGETLNGTAKNLLAHRLYEMEPSLREGG